MAYLTSGSAYSGGVSGNFIAYGETRRACIDAFLRGEIARIGQPGVQFLATHVQLAHALAGIQNIRKVLEHGIVKDLQLIRAMYHLLSFNANTMQIRNDKLANGAKAACQKIVEDLLASRYIDHYETHTHFSPAGSRYALGWSPDPHRPVLGTPQLCVDVWCRG